MESRARARENACASGFGAWLVGSGRGEGRGAGSWGVGVLLGGPAGGQRGRKGKASGCGHPSSFQASQQAQLKQRLWASRGSRPPFPDAPQGNTLNFSNSFSRWPLLTPLLLLWANPTLRVLVNALNPLRWKSLIFHR